MADLLIHEHKKNDAGSYDNVYRKTKAKIVEYTPIPEGNIDKTNVEEALQQVDTYATGMLELINNHIGSKNNPHNVTAEQVGALPNYGGVVNGKVDINGTLTVGGDEQTPEIRFPSFGVSLSRYVSRDYCLYACGAADIKSNDPKSALGMLVVGPEAAKQLELPYGITLTGAPINVSGEKISLVGAPEDTSDAATKGYVDIHVTDKNNPHGVTAEQVGARPNTWTPNASDVGADPVGSSAAVQGNLDTHIQNKQNPHSVTADQIGAAKPGYVFYITLLASNWVDNSQTVSDIGFVTSGYAYLINPSDEDFISWNDCIVRGKDVEQAGKMNFICEEQPSSDIVVKIVRMEVSA